MYSDFTQLDSSYLAGKNRVRSMVNQLNAAVSSTRPAIPSGKPTPTFPSTGRPGTIEPTIHSPTSTNKPTITSPNRPSLQRAMTINNNNPVTPSSPPTINNNNNNSSSTYKRR